MGGSHRPLARLIASFAFMLSTAFKPHASFVALQRQFVSGAFVGATKG